MGISPEEIKWAVEQLSALHYIEMVGGGIAFRLTELGAEKAQEILDRQPICDKLIVILLCADIGAAKMLRDRGG